MGPRYRMMTMSISCACGKDMCAVVDRYGENIDYWEIGNEMSSLQFWNKVRKGASLVEVNIYAAMLTLAYQKYLQGKII
jgi:hypothetical protein